MERLVYEFKPFFCLGFGSVALNSDTMWRAGLFPAALLVWCGSLILLWRLSYRGYLGKQAYDWINKQRHF